MTLPKSAKKTDSIALLRRAGVPPDVLGKLMLELPEVIDFEQYEAVYLKYGVSLSWLRESLGDSP